MQMMLKKRLMLAILLMSSVSSVQTTMFVDSFARLGRKEISLNTFFIKFVMLPWATRFAKYFPATDQELCNCKGFQLKVGEFYRLWIQIAVEVANKHLMNEKVNELHFAKTYHYGMLLHKLAATGICALKLDKLFTSKEIAAYKKWAAGYMKGVLGFTFDELVCSMIEQLKEASGSLFVSA